MSIIPSEFNHLINLLKAPQNFFGLNEVQTMEKIKPLVRKLAESPTWLTDKYYVVDQGAGFNGYKIFENPDHTMAVFVTSWLGGRGAPPHNHGTWSISAGITGSECHTFWRRLDKGDIENYAVIEVIYKKFCNPKDIFCFDSSIIHSVANESSQVAISLQVYGKHPHFTDRRQFNPSTYEASIFHGKEIE